MTIAVREVLISPSANVSRSSMNVECEILTSFFEDINKVVSIYSFQESMPQKKKSKLQKLKDLGLLGAIKDSEITSENYKDFLERNYGNAPE